MIVPPSWAHATISAVPEQPLTFGAWCDRGYGFEYDEVRKHKGLAWFPLITDNGKIGWVKNQNYVDCALVVKHPEKYIQLGISSGKPIYTQYEENPEKITKEPIRKGVIRSCTQLIRGCRPIRCSNAFHC